jgi:hypothetical protein
VSENLHYVEFLVELRTRAFLHMTEQEHQRIMFHHRKCRGYFIVGRLGTVLIKLGSLLEALALTEERMVVDV